MSQLIWTKTGTGYEAKGSHGPYSADRQPGGRFLLIIDGCDVYGDPCLLRDAKDRAQALEDDRAEKHAKYERLMLAEVREAERVPPMPSVTVVGSEATLLKTFAEESRKGCDDSGDGPEGILRDNPPNLHGPNGRTPAISLLPLAGRYVEYSGSHGPEIIYVRPGETPDQAYARLVSASEDGESDGGNDEDRDPNALTPCSEEETDNGGSALADRLLCEERGIVCALPARKKPAKDAPKPLRKAKPAPVDPPSPVPPVRGIVEVTRAGADAWMGRTPTKAQTAAVPVVKPVDVIGTCPACEEESAIVFTGPTDKDEVVRCDCGEQYTVNNPLRASDFTAGRYSQEPLPKASPPVPAPKASPLAAAVQAAQKAQGGAAHLIVEARAGTGKTTTLVEGLKRLRGIPSPLVPSPQQAAVWDAMQEGAAEAKSVGFVAFNKSIADELRSRVPAGCDACTMHSLGFSAVRSAFGKVEVSEYRVADILADVLGEDGRELRKTRPLLCIGVEKLVGLCKMNLLDGTPEDCEQMERHHQLELEHEREDVFDCVPEVLERCRDVSSDKRVDYNDMIWLPVVLSLPVRKYDLLLVDEAQDLNRCQQALAKAAGRRLVLCGDPKQAIYGFAGADAESMPRMEEELRDTPRGVKVLPLTVTRRCGKAIVAEAQRIVPDFGAFDANPEGEVRQDVFPCNGTNDREGKPRKIVEWEKSYAASVKPGDMLLCRVNAPLVSQCFRFLRRGVRATIQGRDIGAGLVSLVKKMHAKSVPDLVGKLDDWLQKETEKEQAKRNPSEARLIALQDKVDCLLCFTEECPSVDAVVAKIEAMFTDAKDSASVRLSSIHKAKGLEADRVYLLEPEGATVPHPMAKGEWQREQEFNLRYVAITRAIHTLVYVK